MSTASVEHRRQEMDDTAVRVVRALMSWHGLSMPDIGAVIDASNGTVERRLSRNARTRKSWQGWELQMLAEYFGVPVECFYTGRVDLAASRVAGSESGAYRPTNERYLAGNGALPELVAA